MITSSGSMMMGRARLESVARERLGKWAVHRDGRRMGGPRDGVTFASGCAENDGKPYLARLTVPGRSYSFGSDGPSRNEWLRSLPFVGGPAGRNRRRSASSAGLARPPLQVAVRGPRSFAKIWLISAWRNRNSRSSSFLRRIQLVTSALHLLVLHERQQGTTLASAYLPPREMGSTQSFCKRCPRSLPQYAQPPHADFSASHCESVRSCTFAAMRRLRRRAYWLRAGLRVGTRRDYRAWRYLSRPSNRRLSDSGSRRCPDRSVSRA